MWKSLAYKLMWIAKCLIKKLQRLAPSLVSVIVHFVTQILNFVLLKELSKQFVSHYVLSLVMKIF